MAVNDDATKQGVQIIRDKVRANVRGGNPNGRYIDGLIMDDDGTYSAIEVKSGTARRTDAQTTFDNIVNNGAPATANLHVETVQIIEVILKEVPQEWTGFTHLCITCQTVPGSP